MNYNSKTYYLHSGNIRGYASYTLYDTEDKHSISILRNDTFINCENVAKALANALNLLITTAMKENENDMMVEIYPVPADDFITIRFNGNSKDDYQLQLFDLSGKRIYHQRINPSKDQYSFKIEISDLTVGTYIFMLYSNVNSVSGKIIKY